MGNYFKGLKEAKTFSKGVYFLQDVQYDLIVRKMYVIETQDKGDAFIAEFEVEACSDPRHPKGFTVSYYQGLVNKNVAFGQLKLLMYAIAGKDPANPNDQVDITAINEEIEEEMAKAVEENSLEGFRVRCQTKKAVTK